MGSPFGWLDGGHSEGFGAVFEDEFVDAVEVDFLYCGVMGEGVFAKDGDDAFNVISVPACVGSANVLLVELGVLVREPVDCRPDDVAEGFMLGCRV